MTPDTISAAELTDHLPFVNSPTSLVLLLLSYCSIIYFSKTKWKATTTSKVTANIVLRVFIVFHNTFLAFLSLWMGSSMVYHVWTKYPQFWCIAFNPVRDKEIAFIIYIFYLSKFYEFFDTYIMILKRNFQQITFLHVYHHVSTCIIFWLVTKFAPGGDAWICVTLNCWVHVQMYTYYQLSSLLTNPETREKYLWWRVYQTQAQMLQFALNLLHSIWAFIHRSPYWSFGNILLFTDMTILLVLFSNFYIKRYISCRTSSINSSRSTNSLSFSIGSKTRSKFR